MKCRKALLRDVPDIVINAKSLWLNTSEDPCLPKITRILGQDIEHNGGWVFEDNGTIVGCVVFTTVQNWWTKTFMDSNLLIWLDKPYRTFAMRRKCLDLCRQKSLETGRNFYLETYVYNKTKGTVTKGRIL